MAENERDIKKDPSDPGFFHGVEVEFRFYRKGETPPPDDVEDGFVLSYTEAELKALGGGSTGVGLGRALIAFREDPRPLFEKIMDTRRPLQDELDDLFPPPPPEVLN